VSVIARGLSDLQRYVLREAAQRKRLFYAHVLAGYFGFEPEGALAEDPGNSPRSA
jgi:hypothetical protein